MKSKVQPVRVWLVLLATATIACGSSGGGERAGGDDGGAGDSGTHLGGGAGAGGSGGGGAAGRMPGAGGRDAGDDRDAGGREDSGRTDGGDAGAAGDAGDASMPSSVLIVAAEGGEVHSEDGALTLYVPAGALAEDTAIAIRELPESEWPAEVAASEPLAAVYDITPDGLEFVTPAYVRHRFETAPAALRPGDDYVAAHHYARSASGVIEPALHTETFFQSDGSVEVFALIDHLSAHYASDRGAGGEILTIGILLDTSPHLVGETFRAAQLHARVSAPYMYTWYRAESWVVSYNNPYLAPVGGDGWSSSGVDYRDDWFNLAMHDYSAQHRVAKRTSMAGTLSPDTSLPLSDPLPGFRCDEAGESDEMRLLAGFGGESPSSFTPSNSVGVNVSFGMGRCLAPAGPRPDAAVLLGDFCEATRETSTITCLTGMTGVLANAIAPAPSVQAGLTELDATTTIFEGVTSWESVAGPPEIEMTTMTHTVTATHDGTSYVPAGLTSGPVFTHPENLSVSGTPPGETEPVTVEVPSIALEDVFYGTLLGDVNGLATEMRFADGDFDAMYVHATAAGSAAAGEAGVMRLVPASAMAIDGANIRSAPLFDAATIAELETRGLTIETILVGPVRFVASHALFPGRTVPVIAGRFHRFAAALLEPAPPPGECLPASANLALAVSGRASLCYDLATGVCGMQHQDSCGLSKKIGHFAEVSSDLRFVVDANDVIVSASHGTITATPPLANRIQGIPADTDVTIVIDMASGFGTDHVQFTLRRATGSSVVEILDLQRVSP